MLKFNDPVKAGFLFLKINNRHKKIETNRVLKSSYKLENYYQIKIMSGLVLILPGVWSKIQQNKRML